MVSQITSRTSVNSIVYSGADQKKTSKLSATGLCDGNSPVNGAFPAQKANNAEIVSIWWRNQDLLFSEIWQHPLLAREGYQEDQGWSHTTWTHSDLTRTSLPCSHSWGNITEHMTSWLGNYFRITGPLGGDFPGHRWPERTVEQTAELPVTSLW